MFGVLWTGLTSVNSNSDRSRLFRTSFAESRLGIEGTLTFLEGECLHKVFGIVGSGDGKGVSSLIGILIVSSINKLSPLIDTYLVQ
jgi:hypothetical protein